MAILAGRHQGWAAKLSKMASFLKTHHKGDCCACGACVQACHKGALRLERDEFGFRYPVVDSARCIQCGLCQKVCPIDNPQVVYHPSCNGIAVGGYCRDMAVRAASSSGGFFTGIVRKLWKPGTVVFGVEEDGVASVRHGCSETLDGISRFRGSKYLASDTGKTFAEAKAFLSKGRQVVYSGTPCQIAGLKAYLGEMADNANLFTIDLVCHGYFAPLYLEKEIAYYEKKQKSPLVKIEWRNKEGGHWRNGSRFIYRFGSGLEKWADVRRKTSPLHRAWLGHLICRPSCPVCRFARGDRVSDVSLGDYWHVDEVSPMFGGDWGTSAAFGNSKRGCEILNSMSDEFCMERVDREAMTAYKFAMHGPWKPHPRMEEATQDLLRLDYRQWVKKWTKPTLRSRFGALKRRVVSFVKRTLDRRFDNKGNR